MGKTKTDNSAWKVAALTDLDSSRDGDLDVAVLGVKNDGTGAAVQIQDARSRQELKWIGFPASS